MNGMPGKLLAPSSMAQNGDLDHSFDEYQPFNERQSLAVNASIAAAISGRSMRTQAALNNTSARSVLFNGNKQNEISKALDAVRNTWQRFINVELHAVLQKYVKEFIEPAMMNVKSNLGTDSIGEPHLNAVLCKILDEAKLMYRETTPTSEAVAPSTTAFNVDEIYEPFKRYGKRRQSDELSDSSSTSSTKKAKTVAPKPKKEKIQSVRKTSIDRPGDREKPVAELYNSAQSTFIHNIDSSTKFILGVEANKILGFASARGRIYVKFPGLFHYAGDGEDKQWLFEQRIMTTSGGKAFLVIADDVREILRLQNTTTRDLVSETKNFTLPAFLLEKVTMAAEAFINNEGRSRSGSNVSNVSRESRKLSGSDAEDGVSDVEGFGQGTPSPGGLAHHPLEISTQDASPAPPVGVFPDPGNTLGDLFDFEQGGSIPWGDLRE